VPALGQKLKVMRRGTAMARSCHGGQCDDLKLALDVLIVLVVRTLDTVLYAMLRWATAPKKNAIVNVKHSSFVTAYSAFPIHF
jgi:hypothetical protein